MKEEKITKVDLGAGTRKKDGFYGIDINKYEGIDEVLDLRFQKLPFKDGQLDHVYCSHFLEHLDFHEACFLFNEVYRVLKTGGTFEIIVPHAMSYAQVADLSHKSAWTEDTFGYFTPQNKYFYSWFYELDGERIPIINRWTVKSNDQTPPYLYTEEGWVEKKLREVHAFLEKLPRTDG